MVVVRGFGGDEEKKEELKQKGRNHKSKSGFQKRRTALAGWLSG